MDDKKTKELLAKCENNKDNPELMKQCQEMKELMAKNNVQLEDMPNQTYTNMAENISAEDVPKVLEMALKIAKSGNIQDTEVKIAAERLIRTLEPL
jgi:DNA-binding transcriptional regulator GbsR (MarR family)